MFGCVLPGKPVLTNLQQVDETHAVFYLGHPAEINHICVFLLGTVPFPDGYAATVHMHWPGRGFQLLGMLSNEKPSAIFRVRGSFSGAGQAAFSAAASSDPSDFNAMLGLAIEPLAAVQEQCAAGTGASSSALTKQLDPTALAERIVKHLFNYLSSFATSGSAVTPETYVPMGAITKWYESFLAKIKAGGTGFLEREEN
ncbi:hypothetical protein M422DRAFT_33960 [Sphaerobolus stellatus SS14]|uniref:Hikeshi-like domain-containing protein n=1 Tax=Sphaerobolus stellatus (strain SS14) TaxID=990650 RepID=A0A0C9UQT5_SPHS4|nr:hypothetical protein M422DRAFT_33960 [Sphaerobolus stellatus SS14]